MLNKIFLRSIRATSSTKLLSNIWTTSFSTGSLNANSEASFITTVIDPQEHTSQQAARFYQISTQDEQTIFLHGGIPKSYKIQCQTFVETRFMVRKPSLDVINIIKSTDFERDAPMRRFVLYGKKGSGKSLSLAHIIHYGYKAGFLIVHVPWVGSWTRRCKEYSNSLTKEGMVDLNLDAAAWLVHFKTQNAHLLTSPSLVTSKDYVWSKRETTPAGSSLNMLIEHGINRVKYASDCVTVLCDEIKELSTQSKCKTLVAIDGFNALFYPNTRVYTEKKEMVPPQRITLAEGFVNLLKSDWRNAVGVVTVDEIAIAEKDQISHLPRYLLGKAGFDHLDPFIPILVPGYNDTEFLSCMNYYRERKWVRDESALDEELRFLSALNPYKLMTLCFSL